MMQEHRRRSRDVGVILLFASSAFALAACDVFTSDSYTQLAIIVMHGDTFSLSSPDTVLASEPFDVVVWTDGGGCVERDRTEVHFTRDIAQIRPYNRYRRSDCTDDFRFISHTVTLEFNQAGVATIQVVGREELLTGEVRQAQIERPVVVR